MLKEIYNYAIANNLVKPKGYVERKLVAHIVLDDNGKFIGIETKDEKDKTKTLCPDLGRKTQGTKISNVICEKWTVIFSTSPTDKQNFYIEKLKEASEFEPKLSAAVIFIESIIFNKEILENFIKTNFKDKKIKEDYISFKINSEYIEDMNTWKSWYEKLFNKVYEEDSSDKTETMISFITGKEIVPIKLMDKVKGTGLDPKGDGLVSFYSDSFCSYGLIKCLNAAISQEEADIINAGFYELCTQHSNTIGDTKIIHWYKNQENAIEDAFEAIFNTENNMLNLLLSKMSEDNLTDEDKNQLAKELIDSIYNGKNIEIKDNDIYYSYQIASSSGRIKILNSKEGSYSELKQNISLWKEDLSICGITNSLSFNFLYDSLLLKKPKKYEDYIKEIKTEFGDNLIKLLYAIAERNQIPECFVKNALFKIKHNVYKDTPEDMSICFRILKAYLIRENIKKGKDNYIMNELNKENPSVAYQLGRMFAVYEVLQSEAMPGNNVSVMERYYASASSTPAIVFGSLARQASIYFGKLDKEWKVIRYKGMLQEISERIDKFPKILNLEEQAMFSLGYYQQRNYIFTKKDESNNKEDK